VEIEIEKDREGEEEMERKITPSSTSCTASAVCSVSVLWRSGAVAWMPSWYNGTYNETTITHERDEHAARSCGLAICLSLSYIYIVYLLFSPYSHSTISLLLFLSFLLPFFVPLYHSLPVWPTTESTRRRRQ